jgi:hypothetical protein
MDQWKYFWIKFSQVFDVSLSILQWKLKQEQANVSSGSVKEMYSYTIHNTLYSVLNATL